MKITAPKEKYIFVELTRADMEKMNITWDTIDYSEPKTREIIQTLLRDAKQSLGCSLDLPERVKIDVLPSLDGGCLLFFTVRNRPLRYKLKGREAELSFYFESGEDAFDLARNIGAEEAARIKSSIYIFKGKTLLFIRGKLRHSLIARINEYAFSFKPDGYTTALIKEYGICAAKDNALQIFSGRASE